jgi:flagellar assembly factor FliW
MTPQARLAVVTEPATTAPPDTASETPLLFDRGMLGFPENRAFVLAATSREGLYWLQSTENEALCFILADPFVFFPGYAVEIPDIDTAYLEARNPDDVAVLVTVTLSDQPGRASTANLQGPIAINVRNRKTRQIVVNQPGFGVRELLDLARGR